MKRVDRRGHHSPSLESESESGHSSDRHAASSSETRHTPQRKHHGPSSAEMKPKRCVPATEGELREKALAALARSRLLVDNAMNSESIAQPRRQGRHSAHARLARRHLPEEREQRSRRSRSRSVQRFASAPGDGRDMAVCAQIERRACVPRPSQLEQTATYVNPSPRMLPMPSVI